MRFARLCLPFFLALVAGCGPAGNRCLPFPLAPDRLVIAGERTEVVLRLLIACDHAPEPRAEQVAVEAFDPDNRPFHPLVSAPIREGDPERDASGFEVVRIVFTPDRAGPWRFLARFDPSIGQVDATVHAVAPRTDAGVRIIDAVTPEQCSQLGLTDRGTILCAGVRALSGSAELVTGTGQRLEGRVFSLNGNVLWRVTSDARWEVERLVDEGDQFRATHRGAVTELAVGALVASDDGAWVMPREDSDGPSSYRPILHRIHPEPDGGLSITSQDVPVRWATGVVFTGTEGYLVGEPGTSVVRIMPHGGLETTVLSARASVAGAGNGHLWLWNERTVWDFASGASTPMPTTAFRIAYGVLSPQAPVVRMVRETKEQSLAPLPNAYPRVREGLVEFETFDPGPGFEPTQSATARHVFARSLDGKQVKVFDR